MEIAAIFGRGAMERCAMLHSKLSRCHVESKLRIDRTIITNVPTVDTAPESLAPVILKLNPHIYTPHSSNVTREEAEEHIQMVDQAIDLCSRLLRLDATKRITAANALRHPFIAPRDPEEEEEAMEDMVEDQVLDINAGKCGHLHGMDGNKREISLEVTTRADIRSSGVWM